MEKIEKYKSFLSRTCRIEPVVFFRIFFGLLMAYFCLKYRSNTHIYTYFIDPDFLFSYPLMDWLGAGVLPAKYLFALYKIMFISAVCIALGLFYRSALFIFCLTFSYGFLLDKTHFNNHYYFISLISFLMIFIPANGRWSLDVLFGFSKRRENIQYWHLFILQTQICLVYFFGGITKLDPDWMNMSVVQSTFIDYPQWAIYLITYGGLVSDFSICFLLLMPRYRMLGVVWAFIFHFLIKMFVDVGIFPFMMLGTLVLFGPANRIMEGEGPPLKKITFALIHLYLMLQLLLPWHHFIYPGKVNWTKEGDRFAWRMFSQEDLGHLDIFVTDTKTMQTIKVPRLKGITLAGYDEMTTYPKMIWHYVQYLKDVYKEEGIVSPVIKVDSFVSLNGRNFSRMIDPEVNLAEVHYPFYHHAPWILRHPDVREDTGIPWYNIGAFFEPAYQLVVIDSKGLIPGDDPLYIWYQTQIHQLQQKYNLDAQVIADKLVHARMEMWKKGGPLLSIRKILEFNNSNAQTFEDFLERVSEHYVLQL